MAQLSEPHKPAIIISCVCVHGSQTQYSTAKGNSPFSFSLRTSLFEHYWHHKGLTKLMCRLHSVHCTSEYRYDVFIFYYYTGSTRHTHTTWFYNGAAGWAHSCSALAALVQKREHECSQTGAKRQPKGEAPVQKQGRAQTCQGPTRFRYSTRLYHTNHRKAQCCEGEPKRKGQERHWQYI